MSWYYHDGQKPVGPIEEAEIIRLAASGAISGRTPVWKQDMAAWVTADASEIKAHLVSVPPPLPQVNPPPIGAATPSASSPGLVQPRTPPRSVGWMTFWGFIWAGLGQLILGQTAKGFVLMATDVLLMLVPGGLLISLVVSVVSAIDAHKIAKCLRAGQPVDPWAFFPNISA